jgi:hypothetical protein
MANWRNSITATLSQGGNNGLQETSKDFRRLQQLAFKNSKRLQRTSADFTRIQGTSSDFMRLQETSCDFNGFHETSEDFKGLDETS